MATDFEYFKEKVFGLTGLDLNSYKEKQILRRLGSLMDDLGAQNFSQYYKILEKDPKSREAFLRRVTINVSEYFRNGERFQELAQVHLPKLVAENPQPKIWSAGCSTGEEPYTLSILMLEMCPEFSGKILATDLDPEAIAFAKRGIYPAPRIRNVPPSYRNKYFSTVAGGEYQVKEQVKAQVEFRRQDLLRDPFGENYDLILCRNVVIYFTEPAKAELYKRFHRALRTGGVLFTGATEQIFGSRELGFVNLSPFFYQKTDTKS